MKDNQLPKNEFVREQIKDKPKNHKRMWQRLYMSALSGLVFAMAMCVVLILMIPVLWNQWEEQEAIPDTGTAVTQMESQESQTQEDWQNDISEQSLTLEEYQLIQNRLYAIGSQANKSIVTITSVVSDTDWFNNSYELEGQGTGTIIGERGGNLLILTEKKVIKDASKISVTFINNTVAPAELMKYDGNTGLAVLSVDKSELEEKTLSAISVMEIASATNSVRKGSIVIALGSPLGTNYSILTGNITATNNEISTQDNNYYVFTTDIVANKNSSGILIDTDGELVGIVMQSYGADLASTLTAIDVSEIQMLLDLLFADKDVPYLGVLGSTVTDAIADEYGIPKGVYIKEVTMDSPAMNAGLQSGDVILSLAGEDVHTVREYNTVLMGLSVEETYTAVIKREGTNGYQTINCKIKIGVLK
jgi:serine protease Do